MEELEVKRKTQKLFSDIYGSRDGHGTNLAYLKGCLIPEDIEHFVICILTIEEAPDYWESDKIKITFRYSDRTSGRLADSSAERCHIWGVNLKNGKRLRAYTVNDSLEELEGAFIQLLVRRGDEAVTDPKTGEPTAGLTVNAVKLRGQKSFVPYPPPSRRHYGKRLRRFKKDQDEEYLEEELT